MANHVIPVLTAYNREKLYIPIRHLISIALFVALIGCSNQDPNKPHEYIHAVSYGDNWTSTEENHYKFSLVKINNFFKLGTGECEEYLKELDAEEVYVGQWAINSLILSESEGVYDVPIKYTKLQCIAYSGQDHSCEAVRNEGLKKIESKVSKKEFTAFFLKTLYLCDIKKEIGSVRTFSLDDSKNYKYVSKRN